LQPEHGHGSVAESVGALNPRAFSSQVVDGESDTATRLRLERRICDEVGDAFERIVVQAVEETGRSRETCAAGVGNGRGSRHDLTRAQQPEKSRVDGPFPCRVPQGGKGDAHKTPTRQLDQFASHTGQVRPPKYTNLQPVHVVFHPVCGGQRGLYLFLEEMRRFRQMRVHHVHHFRCVGVSKTALVLDTLGKRLNRRVDFVRQGRKQYPTVEEVHVLVV
jgi:hypothetical protein